MKFFWDRATKAHQVIRYSIDGASKDVTFSTAKKGRELVLSSDEVDTIFSARLTEQVGNVDVQGFSIPVEMLRQTWLDLAMKSLDAPKAKGLTFASLGTQFVYGKA